DIFLPRQLNDLIRRFAKCEHSSAGKTLCGQFTPASFQIRPVLLHLFALSKLELIKVPCHPAVSDMDEKEWRVGHARQRLDGRKNRLVGRTIVERNGNVCIHGKNDETQMDGM